MRLRSSGKLNLVLVALVGCNSYAAAQVQRLDGITAGNAPSQSSFCCEKMISEDGRFLVFSSDASNLVAGDTNANKDVFVRDRMTSLTTRVSINDAGLQGNLPSFASGISSTGRYVVFSSRATNLVLGDTNSDFDVFVHDRELGVTTRVSVDSNGNQANGSSSEAAISGDGRFVVFNSLASNLVESDTNNLLDVFVHDRILGETKIVSVSSEGVQGNVGSSFPSISLDGRFVAFSTISTNLVANDTNLASDVFVRDLLLNVSTRESLTFDDFQANGRSDFPVLSHDGRYVAFESDATNLVAGDANGVTDVFVRDRLDGTTVRASVNAVNEEGNSNSNDPSISSDGKTVVFRSSATNLFPGDANGQPDIFLVNDEANFVFRVSTDSNFSDGNGASLNGIVSGNGRLVLFDSDSTNWFLDGGAQGPHRDVFVALQFGALPASTTRMVSIAPNPSLVGQAVLVTVEVIGANNAPFNGRIDVSANSGEACSTTDFSPAGTNAIAFSCVLTFDSLGQREIRAAFSGATTHAFSSTLTAFHHVVMDDVFETGFE